MEMIKCTCGDGTAKVLETLRATSAETIPLEDWNDVVKAVNEAGGINKNLIGFPRVTLAKAVAQYNEGVLKGDYVGHPFRGNQHTNASGAGATGGAMASGAPATGGDAFYKLELEAESMVSMIVRDKADETVDKINDLIDGVKNVRQASRSAMDQTAYKRERDAHYTGDEGDSNPNSAEYDASDRANERVINESAKVDTLLNTIYGKIKYATGTARKDGDELQRVQSRYNELPAMAKDLQVMRSRLRDAYDAERSAQRIGLGDNGATARIGSLQTAVKQAIDVVEELQNEVEFAGSNAREMAIEMRDGQ